MSDSSEQQKVIALRSIASSLKENNKILETLNENFVALVKELQNADVVIEANLSVEDNTKGNKNAQSI